MIEDNRIGIRVEWSEREKGLQDPERPSTWFESYSWSAYFLLRFPVSNKSINAGNSTEHCAQVLVQNWSSISMIHWRMQVEKWRKGSNLQWILPKRKESSMMNGVNLLTKNWLPSMAIIGFASSQKKWFLKISLTLLEPKQPSSWMVMNTESFNSNVLLRNSRVSKVLNLDKWSLLHE